MDSDDDTEQMPAYRGVPATIILINVFDHSNNKTGEVSLRATCRLIRQYLRKSSSQYLSVSLYGTEQNDAPTTGLRSIQNIFPLTSPTLVDYESLKKTDITAINQAKELILSDALWHCSKMFANCKKQLSSRTILILTNLDVPPTTADQKPTLNRVVDLVDSNIDIRFIRIAETDCKIDPFYYDFLLEENKGASDYTIPTSVWDEKDIQNVMLQQSHRHLAVARLSFDLGGDVNIGVGLYNLLKGFDQSRFKTSLLDRDTNALVTNVTKTVKMTVNEETNMDVDSEPSTSEVPVLKSEILHYQEFGGVRVEFSDNEMKTLKNPFGPPTLKLLGFKPASVLCKEKWYLKKGYFLYPNEDLIEGSTVAFKALHKACSEMAVVALCILCTRVNSRPLNVALAPCTKPLGLDVDIGFNVVCIPFVENLRFVPFIEEDLDSKVSPTDKSVMTDLLNNLVFDYKPDMFENPKLQSQYRAIEAIALSEEDQEKFIDTTKPYQNRFEDIPDEIFQETFGPFGVSATVKRSAPKEGGVSKKPKVENIDEELLNKRVEDGTVTKYTVPELKQILKYKDAPDALTGLNKAKLVDLVYSYCK